MDNKDIIAFFDRCAPEWDRNMVRNETVIDLILDNGGIRSGLDVLDVACGTGVLFPDYIARGAARITGIDISPEMAKIAAGKYPGRVAVICGDVLATNLDCAFDVIMVYNAFPHFPDPERLISVLCGLLKPGGRLSVAHGMSRAAVDRHHSGTANRISTALISEKELAAILARHLNVDVIISDERMYQVSGIHRRPRNCLSLGHG